MKVPEVKMHEICALSLLLVGVLILLILLILLVLLVLFLVGVLVLLLLLVLLVFLSLTLDLLQLPKAAHHQLCVCARVRVLPVQLQGNDELVTSLQVLLASFLQRIGLLLWLDRGRAW